MLSPADVEGVKRKQDTWWFYFIREVAVPCYALRPYLGRLCQLSGCYDTRRRGEQGVSGEVIICKSSLLSFFFKVASCHLIFLGLLKLRSNTVHQNRTFFIFIWYQGIPDFSLSIIICLEAERQHSVSLTPQHAWQIHLLFKQVLSSLFKIFRC